MTRGATLIGGVRLHPLFYAGAPARSAPRRNPPEWNRIHGRCRFPSAQLSGSDRRILLDHRFAYYAKLHPHCKALNCNLYTFGRQKLPRNAECLGCVHCGGSKFMRRPGPMAKRKCTPLMWRKRSLRKMGIIDGTRIAGRFRRPSSPNWRNRNAQGIDAENLPARGMNTRHCTVDGGGRFGLSHTRSVAGHPVWNCATDVFAAPGQRNMPHLVLSMTST